MTLRSETFLLCKMCHLNKSAAVIFQVLFLFCSIPSDHQSLSGSIRAVSYLRITISQSLCASLCCHRANQSAARRSVGGLIGRHYSPVNYLQYEWQKDEWQWMLMNARGVSISPATVPSPSQQQDNWVLWNIPSHPVTSDLLWRTVAVRWTVYQ